MTLKNSDITVGILGLQGAFHKHQKMLERLSVNTIKIRYPEEIQQCDGIILPGGESTTMTKLLKNMEMFEPLNNYNGPVFGTCAGAILLSTDCHDKRVKHLKKIPVQTTRNAFGRQIESFVTNIEVTGFDAPYPGVFIRAPQFVDLTKNIEIVGTLGNKPVFLKYENILVTSFHPELTEDTRIHEYFLNMIR
ncbi:MAG TPA: pyridoxal 5'-phosphate synthase glutaminase subunit PdxT [Bacteroidales bacterium]|nr:pyridoxal 5'-phosphate synthase glutaminase subunit PdxT [Bacteroidales bacterium]